MDNKSIDKFEFSNSQIATLRNTVAKGANQDELYMFLHLCKTYGLDPFAKEIWFIKYKDQTSIITSRDGYLKIANRNPHFKGLDSDVVYSGDKFIKTKDGVQHAYSTTNRGNPVGAYALVFRDDRDIPVYAFAPFSDYVQQSNTWRKYPHAMILKVAEAMALKRAFSISGLVTQEEIISETEQIPSLNHQAIHKNKVQELYNRYLAVCDGQKNHALNAIKKIIGDTPSSNISVQQFKLLEDDISQREFNHNEAVDVDEVFYDGEESPEAIELRNKLEAHNDEDTQEN